MNRALRAAEAGQYLAELSGVPKPFTAQKMWLLARRGHIRIFSDGRNVWFQEDALEEYVARGGSPRKSRETRR